MAGPQPSDSRLERIRARVAEAAQAEADLAEEAGWDAIDLLDSAHDLAAGLGELAGDIQRGADVPADRLDSILTRLLALSTASVGWLIDMAQTPAVGEPLPERSTACLRAAQARLRIVKEILGLDGPER